MNILLLGGTADARKICHLIDAQKLLNSDNDTLIYSVAGLVRTPSVPCQVISGGFSHLGGLTHYIASESIKLILDITHPFAQHISNNAIEAAKEMNIPCWRFHRPEWKRQAGDRWHSFNEWEVLIEEARHYRSLLLTVGQLSQDQLDILLTSRKHVETSHIILRTAAPPRIPLPKNIEWIKAIGPFKLDDEQRLMEKYAIDVLISKNSGGTATEAKLSAARTLDIPVFMIERPVLSPANLEFDQPEHCLTTLSQWLNKQTSSAHTGK